MKRLIRGLVDFRQDVAPALKPLFRELADNQEPELLLVTCSDSRVVPHLLTSAEPGDVFVVRTVGNIVAPADAAGISVGDVSEASAIEYALEVLGIRDIAVCGHSNCGAISGAIKGRQSFSQLAPNLVEWLVHAEPAIDRSSSLNAPADLSYADRVSQANVLLQIEHIATYPSVRRRIQTGEVALHGLWFDISHAMVHLYEADQNRFVPLDEAEITRLLGTRLGAT